MLELLGRAVAVFFTKLGVQILLPPFILLIKINSTQGTCGFVQVSSHFHFWRCLKELNIKSFPRASSTSLNIWVGWFFDSFIKILIVGLNFWVGCLFNIGSVSESIVCSVVLFSLQILAYSHFLHPIWNYSFPNGVLWAQARVLVLFLFLFLFLFSANLTPLIYCYKPLLNIFLPFLLFIPIKSNC